MQGYNQRLIEELKNKQTQERVRLPKIQRSEAKTRMAMFKKSLRITATASITAEQERERIKQVEALRARASDVWPFLKEVTGHQFLLGVFFLLFLSAVMFHTGLDSHLGADQYKHSTLYYSSLFGSQTRNFPTHHFTIHTDAIILKLHFQFSFVDESSVNDLGGNLKF